MEKRLHRSRTDRMLGGVCGGLGEYFNVAPVLIRIVFVVVTLAGGSGILAYIILWIVMPSPEAVGAPPAQTIRSNIEGIGDEIRAAFGDKPGAREANAGAQPTGPPGPDQPYPPQDTPPRRGAGNPFLLGALLVAIGIILLLENLGPFWGVQFGQLWPLILVILGAALLLSRKRPPS